MGGVLSVFVVFSMVGAMMDERGGGIGGRLGMPGSNIHQAEHSDKTFDDVVGIDEAKGDLQEIVMYLRSFMFSHFSCCYYFHRIIQFWD